MNSKFWRETKEDFFFLIIIFFFNKYTFYIEKPSLRNIYSSLPGIDVLFMLKSCCIPHTALVVHARKH